MATKVNYSVEMVDAMVAMYSENRDAGLDNADNVAQVISMLEAKFGQFRTKKSVVSKLSREGVYVKDEMPTAAPRDLGPTKKELAIALENRLDTLGLSDVLDVNNIMNATKAGFQGVISIVNALSKENAVEGEEA